LISRVAARDAVPSLRQQDVGEPAGNDRCSGQGKFETFGLSRHDAN